MLAKLESVRLACKANGIAACIHCGDAGYAARMAAQGFDLTTIGSDARFIEAGARSAVMRFRSGLEP
ncbi:hypothetical protein FBQ85_25745 [Cytophagia bacterium CHB2]|nr:hypothetical protein [Cytophagia bacterium CHB2]